MAKSTRVRKLILYVAERKDWREWQPLVRIRPCVDREAVVRKLKEYSAQRGSGYRSTHVDYRVVPYRQDPNGAVVVKG